MFVIFCSGILDCPTIFTDISWYIKVNKNIVDKISINKINDKYIGFHYRNTDMKHELESFIPEILDLSKQYNKLYLGTDDYTAFDRLSNLIKNKLNIIQYTKPINLGGKNIHYGNQNKDEVIMNILIDMYHFIHATYFIPSKKSSVSLRVMQWRKKDEFFE